MYVTLLEEEVLRSPFDIVNSLQERYARPLFFIPSMQILHRSITLAFLLQLLIPPLPIYAQEELMSIQERSWAYAIEEGLMPKGADPKSPMTRMEFLSIVVDQSYPFDDRSRCFSEISGRPGTPPGYTHLFSDVSRREPHAGDLCIGMFVGIVSGRSDGSFGPWSSVSFAEAAKWITRGYNIAPKPPLRPNSTVPWYESYRYAVARRNAIPEGITNPHQLLTRADAAELLYLLRTEKPSYGYQYGTSRDTAVQNSSSNHFDNSPEVSQKSSSPSVSTTTLLNRSGTRITARTRREIARMSRDTISERTLTNEENSVKHFSGTPNRSPTRIGRDWKFIDPDDRPSARSIHEKREATHQ